MRGACIVLTPGCVRTQPTRRTHHRWWHQHDTRGEDRAPARAVSQPPQYGGADPAPGGRYNGSSATREPPAASAYGQQGGGYGAPQQPGGWGAPQQQQPALSASASSYEPEPARTQVNAHMRLACVALWAHRARAPVPVGRRLHPSAHTPPPCCCVVRPRPHLQAGPPAPGFTKAAAGAPDAKRAAALPKVWEYEDPLRDCHGPFDAQQIISWYTQVRDCGARAHVRASRRSIGAV
jgi:hypothetical protein